VPLLEPKVIVNKNSRKVRIYIINKSNSNSYNSIRPYSPNSDSKNKEKLVY
jgi:hypothetical protein